MYGPGEKPKTNLHTQYVSKEDVLEHINQLKNYKELIDNVKFFKTYAEGVITPHTDNRKVGLNIPVIKYSVDWWNTLHQASSITLTSAPTIHYSMLVPLVIMFFGMLIYTLIIFLMRYKTEVIKFKIEKKKNYK